MTQEEKQLLLKDLCARLPYGVKLGFENSNVVLTPKDYCCFTRQLFTNMVFPEHDATVEYGCQFYEYRPYLRSMSRMTEEEKQKYYDLTHQEDDDVWAKCLFDKMVDFCNERHLDYRGLIEKGLALEAPEGMYKNE